MATIDGQVTGIADRRIIGWVAAAGEVGDLHVEALCDGGEPFGRTRAPRSADGRCHFEILIPPEFHDGRPRFMDVRLLGSEQPLERGPVIYDGGLFEPAATMDAPSSEGSTASFAIEGAVTFKAPNMVEGWAWAPGDPGRRVELEILAGDRYVASLTADKLRQDLRAAGVGDARYGFRFDSSRLLRRGPHLLTVRPVGTVTPLPGGQFSVGPFAGDAERVADGSVAVGEPEIPAKLSARRRGPDRRGAQLQAALEAVVEARKVLEQNRVRLAETLGGARTSADVSDAEAIRVLSD